MFVAAVPDTGETLFVRRQRDVAAAQRARVDAGERMLSQHDGMATWMDEVVGISVGELLRKNPQLGEDVRSKMLAGIAAARTAPPAKAGERWAVSERFEGIERAGLVVSIFAIKVNELRPSSWRPMCIGSAKTMPYSMTSSDGAAIDFRLPRWWPTSWTRATQVERRRSAWVRRTIRQR